MFYRLCFLFLGLWVSGCSGPNLTAPELTFDKPPLGVLVSAKDVVFPHGTPLEMGGFSDPAYGPFQQALHAWVQHTLPPGKKPGTLFVIFQKAHVKLVPNPRLGKRHPLWDKTPDGILKGVIEMNLSVNDERGHPIREGAFLVEHSVSLSKQASLAEKEQKAQILFNSLVMDLDKRLRNAVENAPEGFSQAP